MPKNDNFSSVGVDKWDRRIMYALDCNSRQSNSKIAKKLKIGKNFVNYRIRRLEERGIIRGYFTVIDGYKLGNIAIRAYLKWGFVSPEKEREIVDFIIDNSNVWWVGTISGEWSLAMVVWVSHFSEFEKFWFELMDKYQRYIHRRVVAIYSKMWDCSYAFLSPENVEDRPYQVIGSADAVKLSKKELLLLDVLAESARIPTIELAKKTGLSESGVKGVLKRLTSLGVIRGFGTIFDTEMLGYTYYKFYFYLKGVGNYEQMLQFALSHPNTIYVNKTIAFADFEVDVMCRSTSEVRAFLEAFGKRFGESINDYGMFIYEKNQKKKYFSLARPGR